MTEDSTKEIVSYQDFLEQLPPELLKEILIHLDLPDLVTFRLISKSLQNHVQMILRFQILHWKNGNLDFSYQLLDNGSKVKILIFYHQTLFDEVSKDRLLSALLALHSKVNPGIQIYMELDVHQLTSCFTILKFLEETSKIIWKMKLKIEFVITDESLQQRIFENASFLQVISLDFPNFQLVSSWNCLIGIAGNQKCPNLKKLSMGNLQNRFSHQSLENMSLLQDLFTYNFIKNVVLSTSILNSSCFTDHDEEFWLDLKGRKNVTFQSINFNFYPLAMATVILQIFGRDLEKVFGLFITPGCKNGVNFKLRSSVCLENLKVLEVRCRADILIQILAKTSKLETLSWESDGSKLNDDNRVQNEFPPLLNLTSLTLVFFQRSDLYVVELIGRGGGNMKVLKYYDMEAGEGDLNLWLDVVGVLKDIEELHLEPFCSFLQKFLNQEELEEEGNEKEMTEDCANNGGNGQTQLKEDDPLPSSSKRIRRIRRTRELQKLRKVNLGLVDYDQRPSSFESWDYDWIQTFVKESGLGQMDCLQSITLPPVVPGNIEAILNCISDNISGLKKVELQVWNFPENMDYLTEIYRGKFLLSFVKILKDDGQHCSMKI